MIRFKLSNIEFRIHILMILSMLLSYMLGAGRDMMYMMLAVGVHEAAHIAAAKLCGAEIEYIDIMCFGGAARFRNLYAENRLRLVIIALSGPAANFAFAIAAASLAWWGFIGFYTASMIVRINMILMIFNLMPALPLDGGRILYAAISKPLGKRLAIRIGTSMGLVLALVFVLIAVYGWLAQHVINISLVIMSVFLTASALKEKEMAYESKAEAAMEAMLGVQSLSGFANVAIIRDDVNLSDAIAYFDRHKPTLFACMDGGKITEWVAGDEMARRILSIK